LQSNMLSLTQVFRSVPDLGDDARVNGVSSTPGRCRWDRTQAVFELSVNQGCCGARSPAKVGEVGCEVMEAAASQA